MKFFPMALCIINLTTAITAGPILMFFLREFPDSGLNNNNKHHKKIPVYETIKSSGASGVFATYAGDLDVSDQNGLIEFPLKQINPAFNILITDKITPILYARNTVHHWELEEGTPTAYYTIQRKYDADSRTHYWLTARAETPKNNIIPLDTIIMFGEPDDFFIPEGIVITDASTNWTLPDFYVKPTFDKAAHALYVLNIKNFLHQINLEFQKQEAKNASHIID